VLDLWPDNLYAFLPIKSKFWRGVVQKVSDWHYRRSPRLLAMSDKLGELLRRRYGSYKHPPTISVIPQYSEDFYAEEVRDEALAKKYSGHFNILFAGNISPLQDLENLVNAMKLVRQSGNTNIRCLIVGDGMSRNNLQHYIARQGVQDAFEFCGAVPATDVPRWTSIADALFAGLAKTENLGLTVPGKITSYFAAGRPMLVAADDEAARVCNESGAASTSPAGDADALAQNIVKLYEAAPQQRAAMGTAGKTYYEQNLKRSVLLQKLKKFIFEGVT
jgi:glycosyltransferase involved in cell wall biosynthesis